MLTVVHDQESSNESARGAGRSLLDEIVRDGARQMLAAALQAEVGAYIEAFADQVDENGRRLVVRTVERRGAEGVTARDGVFGKWSVAQLNCLLGQSGRFVRLAVTRQVGASQSQHAAANAWFRV